MKLRHCLRTSLSQEALSTVLWLKIRRHRGCRAGIRRKTRKQITVQNYAEDRSVLPDIHHQYSQLPVDATSDHSSSTVVRTGTATPKAVVRAGSSLAAISTTIRPQMCPTSSSTWLSTVQAQSPQLDITERLQPSPIQHHSAALYSADRWSPSLMSSADVASTMSSPMTLPTMALNTSEPLLQRLSTSTVTSTDTQLSFARSVSDSNGEVEAQLDNSFVIFSPTVSNLSTLTEPHSVSDLSLDFSYGLSSLFGINNTVILITHYR